jgi:hypothetical protein
MQESKRKIGVGADTYSSKESILVIVTSLEMVRLQNVEFQKLELYLSAHETIKDVFLFPSPIPRFNLAPSIILELITC